MGSSSPIYFKSAAANAVVLLNRQVCFWVFTIAMACTHLHAQDNYEIQVYGAELAPVGQTMFELHSNTSVIGTTSTTDQTAPTNHALRETVVITHGFTPWLEVGCYLFTNQTPGLGYNWVGDHIRPRISVPESWKWPIGLSLSTEIGYQRPTYSEDTWTFELRFIADKKWDKLYVAINPTFETSWQGATNGKGMYFAPACKASYQVSRLLAPGIEYYTSLGPTLQFSPIQQQQHQLCPSIDIDFDPKWEFNAGVAFGLTKATDPCIVKVIVGRRF